MFKKIILIILLILVVLGIAVTQAHITYSEGSRSGYIKKFSKNGYIIKTYEGDLVQQINGVLTADSFHFTVKDDKIVQDITRALNNNERVEVKYKQQLYLFQALHGDTQYFVTEVKLNPIIQGEK